MNINHYLRIFRSIFILLIVALFVGCGGGGGGGSSTAAPAVNVSGDWSGTYSSTDKTDYGTISLSLTQTGSTVTGTGSRASEAGDGTVDGSVTGTISGNELTVSLTDGTHIVRANLTINNNQGTGSWSNISSDCRSGCSGTSSLSLQSSTPTAPTGITATPANSQVTIAWTAVAGADYYNIYYSTKSGVTTTNSIKIVDVTSPYTQSTGLTNGTTYYYIVTAVNNYGESAASTPVSATPSAQNVAPTAPTGAIATPGDGQVIISWTAVSGATSYNIYYSSTSGVTPANGSKIDNVTSPQTLTGATNGTTYYFVVTALNANGESAASNQVSATPSASTSAAPYMYAFVSNPAGATSWLQNVYVYTDSTRTTPITSALVTINGTTLAYSSQDKEYEGDVGITEGSTVNLSVTIGSTTCTATGTQYTTFPRVTSPTSGAIWEAANDNTITWTPGTPTTDAEYGIVIYDSTTANPVLGPIYVPTSSTSHTILAKSLTPGSYLMIVSIGRAAGIPITNAAAGSNLWISGFTTTVPFSVQ